MAKVLITGASGLLGTSVCKYLSHIGYKVIKTCRSCNDGILVDLADGPSVRKLLSQTRPDIVVHLAASTNVDVCETEILNTLSSNVASQNLAKYLQEIVPTSHLVYASTDQVYSGQGPHVEDSIAPKNVYGMSKLLGEKACHIHENLTVLRINFVGRNPCNKQSFSDWLVNAFNSELEINLFDDVFFNPLTIDELCIQIQNTIQQKIKGTFNLGCRGGLSKAQFALKLAKVLGFENLDFKLISIKEASFLKAPRPLDMRMEVKKYEKAFGVTLPTIETVMAALAKEYQDVQS